MKAFRIQNDIVAARTPREAIACWADFRSVPYNSVGPVEEVDPVSIPMEAETEPGSGIVDPDIKTVADMMPNDGPAEIVAVGECEDC